MNSYLWFAVLCSVLAIVYGFFLAKKILGKIALGIDLLEERNDSSNLIKIYESYLSARRSLSKVTIYNYNRYISIHLKKWNHFPIMKITNKMIMEE